MAVNGLPPGLAKKAANGGADALPSNNPHVQAYQAQQQANALQQQNQQLQQQNQQLQYQQKTASDVLSFINTLLAAYLKNQQQTKPPAANSAPTTAAAPTGNTGQIGSTIQTVKAA